MASEAYGGDKNAQTGDFTVRKASETDRFDIARMIVTCFHDDFAKLPKGPEVIIGALMTGISIVRFFVAEYNGEAVGISACTDSSGRAIHIDIADFCRCLGLFTGTAAGIFMKYEFSRPLHYPLTTGYIEFVAVSEKHRNKGIAAKMLDEIMKNTDYKDYMLDVTNTNIAAQKCYHKYGFREASREKVKFARLKGFTEKIYMKYTKA